MPVKQSVCLPILPPMDRDALYGAIADIGYPAIEIWGRDDEAYQGDCTDWGLEVVERVDSERDKPSYDIYHMQIMEGDVIRTIGEDSAAIAATDYDGYVGHEFVPRGEVVPALRQAFVLCDV